jgi:hypothetical protein
MGFQFGGDGKQSIADCSNVITLKADLWRRLISSSPQDSGETVSVTKAVSVEVCVFNCLSGGGKGLSHGLSA